MATPAADPGKSTTPTRRTRVLIAKPGLDGHDLSLIHI